MSAYPSTPVILPDTTVSDNQAGRPQDARMLAQQQIRLLGGMSRLLSRLLRGLLWQELTPGERRRTLAFLLRLDSDLRLALSIARGNPLPEGYNDYEIPIEQSRAG